MKQKSLIFLLPAAILAFSGTLSAALVGHFTFDNSANLGADSSGLGNNATGISNVGFSSSGVSNGAAVFTASNQSNLTWTGATNPIANVLSSDFSFSLFLNTTQTFGNNADQGFLGAGIIYADVPVVDVNDTIPMALNGSKLGFFTGPPVDRTIHSTTSINTGTYLSLIVTWSKSTGVKSLYINGVLEAQEAIPSGADLSGRDQLALGGNLFDGRYFTGSVDDFQVYSQTLTGLEASFLSSHPGATVVPEPNSFILVTLGVAAFVVRRNPKRRT